VAALLNAYFASLFIEKHRGDQFRSEISLQVMTENELDHVQIRELLLKSLNPLNADKACCPAGMNL